MIFVMKKLCLLSLLYIQALFSDASLDSYFLYVQQLGASKGDYKKGEIEVVLDVAEIQKVQKTQEERLVKKGFSAADAKTFSHVGLISEDQYWIWLRDAVLFPKGVPGTYDRLIPKSALKKQGPGVAVLPLLPSGAIVLNLNYRHATRSWELELPRGGMDPKETVEEAARREVREETGYVPSTLVFLGYMAPDTGILSSVVPVYLGKVSSKEAADPEDSEAIADVLSFTKEEIQKGLMQGYLEVMVEGKKQKVPLRDAFLTFAFLQADLRKLFL